MRKHFHPVYIFLFLITTAYKSSAQLYKIELDEKINNSTLIVEGKVIAKKSFWNNAHTLILTANTIEIYKIFKGNTDDRTIEVVTQGGIVGHDAVWVSDLLQLDVGKVGIFFCEPNRKNAKSPFTKKVLFDVYSSDQGFFRYDLKRDQASAPFVRYKKIKDYLYKLIEQKTKQNHRVVNSSFDISVFSQDVSNAGAGTLAAISSFSPTTVHGGALEDPANNVLTINGSGFGTKPSGSCAVLFKDANNDNTTPDFEVAYTSSYMVSWSDTKIVIKVPDRAGTGLIAVQLKDGTTAESSSILNVFYSIINLTFDFSPSVDTVLETEPRLIKTNGSDGYTIQYSTSTAGGGKNFATSESKDAFERALATWKANVGVNFVVGTTTDVQKIDGDDNINLVVFDNNNTGVDPMASGVLESTYSYGTICYDTAGGFRAYTAQKTGFDILVRNSGVSVGNIAFEDGPCFPGNNEYDRETIVLHELGHALNLAHINDDAEGTTIPNVNPEKVMHYSILNYIDRRSLDASAYQGGLYTCTPQNDTYGCTGVTEMTQLSRTTISGDDCPASFPSESTPDGTSVNFDLIHATSNKAVDPQFTDVTCNNSGTEVTNNAYYAFKTNSTGALNIQIANYVTSPTELASCADEGIRLAVYDVSTCPEGQNYPPPVSCKTFTGNATFSVAGLQPTHSYLLYFDGIRNTKASFTAVFNGNGVIPTSGISLTPNPVMNDLTLTITTESEAKYGCTVYDAMGRRLYQNEFTVPAGTPQTFAIPFRPFASGIYFVRISGPDGKSVLEKKILKVNR